MKKIKIVFIFLVSFLVFSADVKADFSKNTFGTKYGYTDCFYNGVCYNSYDGVCICQLMKYDDRSTAYCADETLSFENNISYSLDGVFNNDSGNVCQYLDNGVRKYGDCSEIVGNIIAAGGGNYYNTQAAIWAYLYEYTVGYYHNMQRSTAYSSANDTIRNIINKAFVNYAEVENMSSEIVADSLITVNGYEANFYYVPGSSCADSSGSYKTKEFTVSSNDPTKKVVVTFTGSENSKIYINGTGYSNPKTYTLYGANSSITVYLTTTKPFDNYNLNIYAEYESPEKQQFYKYDSIRYHGNGGQGILVPTKSQKISNVVYKQKMDLGFKYNVVNHNVCPDKSTLADIAKNIYSANDDANPVQKVCANNSIENSDDGTPNKNDYEVYFSGCNCMALDLGNGKVVNVMLHEDVGFRFGVLNPMTSYPGGGFRFSVSGESITTDYLANITWEYSDISSNGVPYYYNPTNLADNNASVLEDRIVEAIKNKLNDKLVLNILTKDSNKTSNGSNSFELANSMTSSNYDSGSKMFSYRIDGLKMNKAYFSIDGKVSYEENNKYPIDGGNLYYIPIDYSSGKFPFNISSTNLSISNNNFWYSADCSIAVDKDDNLYDDVKVRYRSINLNDPFPKNVIADNWKDWISNTSNVARLKSTFNLYPDSPLYSINIDRSELNSFDNLPYSSWDNVSVDGSDKFITDNDFSRRANNTSYCEINKFSDNCDRH